jgi:predicted DsbA family dithiol-disulfide isomerase
MNWQPGHSKAPMAPIRIEAIIDTVCPWCYIGKKRLEKALVREKLDHMPITWRPFLLNPDMPTGGIDRKLYLSAKFGGTESATRVYKAIEAAGAAVGIDFNFDAIRLTPDSTDSHRLIYKVCAERSAVGNDLVEDLMFWLRLPSPMVKTETKSLITLGVTWIANSYRRKTGLPIKWA